MKKMCPACKRPIQVGPTLFHREAFLQHLEPRLEVILPLSKIGVGEMDFKLCPESGRDSSGHQKEGEE